MLGRLATYDWVRPKSVQPSCSLMSMSVNPLKNGWNIEVFFLNQSFREFPVRIIVRYLTQLSS